MENKFIVINNNYLQAIKNTDYSCYQNFIAALKEIEEYLPQHYYYVVNVDEPYSDKVKDLILKGKEDIKEATLSLRSGIIEIEDMHLDMRIIVKDYDIEGIEIPEEKLKKDLNDEEYAEIIFENTREAA